MDDYSRHDLVWGGLSVGAGVACILYLTYANPYLYYLALAFVAGSFWTAYRPAGGDASE